jgi:hypothetical protein
MSDLQINGVSQTVFSHSTTLAVFTVTNVLDLVSSNMKLYFPVGLPENHSVITAGITLTPKLMSITPNEGGVGGTLIEAFVPGVGTATTGLDLVDQSDRTIC